MPTPKKQIKQVSSLKYIPNYSNEYTDAKKPTYNLNWTKEEADLYDKNNIKNKITESPWLYSKVWKSMSKEQQQKAFNKNVAERKDYELVKDVVMDLPQYVAPIAGMEAAGKFISKIPVVQRMGKYIGKKIAPEITEDIIKQIEIPKQEFKSKINSNKIAEQPNAEDIVSDFEKNYLKQYIQNKTNYEKHIIEGEKAGIGYFGNYKKGINKIIAKVIDRGVMPYGYGVKEKLKDFIPNLIMGKPNIKNNRLIKNRFDSWRLYNGLEPKYNTFSLAKDGKSLNVNNYIIPSEHNFTDFSQAYSDVFNGGFNFGGIAGHHPSYVLPDKFFKEGMYAPPDGRVFIQDIFDLNPFKNKNMEIGKYTGGKPFNVTQHLSYKKNTQNVNLNALEKLRFETPSDELGLLEKEYLNKTIPKEHSEFIYKRGDFNGNENNEVLEYLDKYRKRNDKFIKYSIGTAMTVPPIAFMSKYTYDGYKQSNDLKREYKKIQKHLNQIKKNGTR